MFPGPLARRWYATAAQSTSVSATSTPLPAFSYILHLESSWPHAIYASERVTDRRSAFLAHATTLSSVDQLPDFLDYITSQPQLKRATHCMYAYRTFKQSPEEPNHHGSSMGQRAQAVSATPPSKSTVLTGQKDGGESGSGDRLARLLQDTRSDNVVLVVSRWYGGIQLGNDRWKRINQVAKEALQKGNFPRPKEDPASSHSASSSRKRRR
ncbi:hypothetical protein PC9H_007719 [Pleurotus ostreatus]|uniref:Impact N-terminal domain-containing protein n=1 Tax=Pleurotus ostreatus TaxID=5322 RepID=A0A8H7DT10_PLEOS|nr:uncharacterized protein PC9H_007719 [Pleurotus ostreatus]KAF7428495.1 hypothetical protein PC9H_007719 [Pleurotus ostreatus]